MRNPPAAGARQQVRGRRQPIARGDLGQPINDNVFIRFERVTFNDNYCSHIASPGAPGSATVALKCRAAIVMGNHIKATAFGVPSVDFGGAPGTFVGNITAGGAVNFADFPNPQSSCNQTLL